MRVQKEFLIFRKLYCLLLKVLTDSCCYSDLQIFPSLAALNLIHSPSTPKLILITPPSLSYGASLELFTTFTSTPGNQLVLLEKPNEEGIGKELFEAWNSLQEGSKKWGGGEVGRSVRMDREVTVEVRKLV